MIDHEYCLRFKAFIKDHKGIYDPEKNVRVKNAKTALRKIIFRCSRIGVPYR